MNKSKKNHSFFASVYHAVVGFKDAFKREQNLRVHVCVANLICFFAAFYGISSVEWAILFLAIGLVVAAELLNSAIEKAVDTATQEICTDAMHAKDFAAAATLISAIIAVLVGIALFGNIRNISDALYRIFTTPYGLIILVILIVIDLRLLFINIRKENGGKYE